MYVTIVSHAQERIYWLSMGVASIEAEEAFASLLF